MRAVVSPIAILIPCLEAKDVPVRNINFFGCTWEDIAGYIIKSVGVDDTLDIDGICAVGIRVQWPFGKGVYFERTYNSLLVPLNLQSYFGVNTGGNVVFSSVYYSIVDESGLNKIVRFSRNDKYTYVGRLKIDNECVLHTSSTPSLLFVGGDKTFRLKFSASDSADYGFIFVHNDTDKWVMHPNGDFEITTAGTGIILRSPNGTRYRLTVDDDGNIGVSPV